MVVVAVFVVLWCSSSNSGSGGRISISGSGYSTCGVSNN